MPLGADQVVQRESQQIERHPPEQNFRVNASLRRQTGRRAESFHQPVEPKQPRSREKRGEQRRDRRGVAEDRFGIPTPPLPQQTRHLRCRADADERADGDHENRQRKRQPDGAKTVGAGEAADEETVDDIVKSVGHKAKRGRNRKPE